VRQYGYTGPVTTAEPASSYLEYPPLCVSDSLDLIGVIAHCFFDPSGTPARCGSFVGSQILVTQNSCRGKNVFVTEAGYPHEGEANGAQVPSYDNQRIALKSMFQSSQGYLTFFTFRDGMFALKMYLTL
jgi:exo-beta-1,3-glucanase (GH17 family)